MNESIAANRVQASAWTQAAKASLVLTFVVAAGVIATAPDRHLLLRRLIIDLPVTYLFGVVISAGIVGLWRTLGAAKTIALLLLPGYFVCSGSLILLLGYLMGR